jgi:hypothetical protein
VKSVQWNFYVAFISYRHHLTNCTPILKIEATRVCPVSVNVRTIFWITDTNFFLEKLTLNYWAYRFSDCALTPIAHDISQSVTGIVICTILSPSILDGGSHKEKQRELAYLAQAFLMVARGGTEGTGATLRHCIIYYSVLHFLLQLVYHCILLLHKYVI